jgi:hypothetical protein
VMEPGSIEGICAGRRSFASASLAAKLALMQVLSRPTNRKAAAGLRSQLRHFPQYTGDVRRALARVRLKPLIRKTSPTPRRSRIAAHGSNRRCLQRSNTARNRPREGCGIRFSRASRRIYELASTRAAHGHRDRHNVRFRGGRRSRGSDFLWPF